MSDVVDTTYDDDLVAATQSALDATVGRSSGVMSGPQEAVELLDALASRGYSVEVMGRVLDSAVERVGAEGAMVSVDVHVTIDPSDYPTPKACDGLRETLVAIREGVGAAD